VYHAGRELPEPVVIGGLFPAAQDRGGQVAGGRRPVDQGDGPGAAFLGALLGQSGGADEGGRQGVHGGDGATDRAGHPRVAGEGIRVERIAVQILVDDGPGAAERRLAHELRHVEGEPAAVADREGAKCHQIGGLLGLGGLRGGNTDDEGMIVAVDQQRRIERAIGSARTQGGAVEAHLDDVETGNGGSGQRG